jgi:hypothetical protein
MRMLSTPARRRALPALAALLACGVAAAAPGLAGAATPGLTLTALDPPTWLQGDGSFRIPLALSATDLISIDRLEIQVDGLPGVISVPVPAQPVSTVGGPGLAIDLPGTAAGVRTIRVTAWVPGDQPAYGPPVPDIAVSAETTVALGSSRGSSGSGGYTSPLKNGAIGGPGAGKGVRPKVLLLSVRTIKGKRYAFVKSSAAVKLDLRANRRVGKAWKTAKRVQVRLLAKKVRRVPFAIAKPGRYQLKAVVRTTAGLTGTRTVKLVLRAPRPR